VAVNVTLAIDDKLVARAREVARKRRTTLNQLVRNYLEGLTAPRDAPTVAQEFERLWAEHEGRSGGRKWRREDLYDRRVLR
jgi:hypothetical protein